MGNQNDLLGPSGGIPAYRDGASYENIAENGNFQVKVEPGIVQRVFINVAGTTSSITLYDGLSSTVSLTLASPGIVNWPKHGLQPGAAIEFTNSGGALPTGLTAGTKVYVTNDANYGPNAFAVSDTQAHALAGTNQIDFTGSQSGTQTGWNVSNLVCELATTSVNPPQEVGAYFGLGIIAIAAGGAASNETVLYN